MPDEILRSIRVSLSERLSSPLMGSFVVAWSLWNYKFFVILFSAASVTKTFELIDSLIFPDLASIVLHGILYPGLTTAAYIFVYPYPGKFVFEFSRKRQKEVNEVRRRIADETLLTLEESRNIRAEFARRENDYKVELDSKIQEIGRLKDVVLALQRPTEKTKESAVVDEHANPRLEPTQIQLLKTIEGMNGVAAHELVIKKSGESRVRTEYDLGVLERAQLIEKEYDGDYRDTVYRFTHEGRGVLLEHSEDDEVPF